MKLDRNITEPRRGKYALIKLRDSTPIPVRELGKIVAFSVDASAVDFGDTADSDFFVIRLKDKYAAPALAAYAMAAYLDDQEYALQVLNLSKQAAEHSNQKQPD